MVMVAAIVAAQIDRRKMRGMVPFVIGVSLRMAWPYPPYGKPDAGHFMPNCSAVTAMLRCPAPAFERLIFYVQGLPGSIPRQEPLLFLPVAHELRSADGTKSAA
ncbi:MAG: hypothetical protein H2052_17365 [Sphingosinicella sp.]|nr:hypothetical protein [Sphingosinicella sp.]